ncbi:MAG: methyltransferase domain-containing protein [Aquabacterium sp.]|uniref:class I SAM-dependent methyltransferase n=1 Tax=Aquabacterium sp. TaxID=1872578 RepID=UPI002718564B|nr:class I SAM-dependent methyltransferase [Aquabacterium sp.]MDO9005620.1 methyltransferase domain-containing protein [Aquabacterium sp.]
MRTHLQTNLDQYSTQAQAYLDSPVHAQGPDLARAQALVAQAIPASGQALDVGCGAGHLSFALAPHLSHVVALDPSPPMLATVQQAARARGMHHIEAVPSSAERLPFPDASFELVCSRYSAHHWTGLAQALKEMRRVLKPGGHLLMIDVQGEEDALVDSHLQAIELLRDRSHVRNRTVSQWRALLADAGFANVVHESWPVHIDFSSWVTRMRTPASRVAMIREVQSDAPREVQEALAIEADGSFTFTTGLFWAQANV